MRPSSISFSSVSRAISRRRPSNDERTTACGVSSMMKSTPVRCSSARMLRPSRPMIRPFMSSDGSSTTRDGRLGRVARRDALERVGDEVARARRFASVRASSSSWRTLPRELVADRSSERSSRCCFASPTRHAGDALELARALRPSPAFSSSWSCFVCVSRSATPCSRRASSSRLPSSSSSRCVEPLLDLRAPAARLVLDLGLDLGAQLRRPARAPRSAPRAAIVSASRSASARIARRWSLGQPQPRRARRARSHDRGPSRSGDESDQMPRRP